MPFGLNLDFTKLKDRFQQIQAFIHENSLIPAKRVVLDGIKNIPQQYREMSASMTSKPRITSDSGDSIGERAEEVESDFLPNGGKSHGDLEILDSEGVNLRDTDILSDSQEDSTLIRDRLTGAILSEHEEENRDGNRKEYREIQNSPMRDHFGITPLLEKSAEVILENSVSLEENPPLYPKESDRRTAIADGTLQEELETDANSLIEPIDGISFPIETAIASNVTLPDNSIEGLKYLMSIVGNNSSKWSKNKEIPDVLKYAIARATDLDSYARADLEQTHKWMFYLSPDRSPERLALFLGAKYEGEGNFIPDTHIFKFSDDFNLSEFLLRLEKLKNSVEYVQPLISTSPRFPAVFFCRSISFKQYRTNWRNGRSRS
jgi:hypothetical protein